MRRQFEITEEGSEGLSDTRDVVAEGIHHGLYFCGDLLLDDALRIRLVLCERVELVGVVLQALEVRQESLEDLRDVDLSDSVLIFVQRSHQEGAKGGDGADIEVCTVRQASCDAR